MGRTSSARKRMAFSSCCGSLTPSISKIRTPIRLFERPRRTPRLGSLCSSKKRFSVSPSVSGSRISPETTRPASSGSRYTSTSSGTPLLTTSAAAIWDAPILRPTTRFVRLSRRSFAGFGLGSLPRLRPKRRGSSSTTAGVGSARSDPCGSTAKTSDSSTGSRCGSGSASGVGSGSCSVSCWSSGSEAGSYATCASCSCSWPYAARRSMTAPSNERSTSSSACSSSSFPGRSSSISRSRRA